MSVYCVYHLIHTKTPHQYIPKLFITEVPSVTWELVDEYADYGEFGIAHANHHIVKIDKGSPPELKRAYREGECEQITYEDLVKRVEEEI